MSKSNIILWQKYGRKRFFATLLTKWMTTIDGTGNCILFKGKTAHRHKRLKGLNIQIIGNNNQIVIDTPVDLKGTQIIIKGNNNYLHISVNTTSTFSTIQLRNGSKVEIGKKLWSKECNIKSYDSGCIIIGENTEIDDHTFIEALDGGKIEIGDECEISRCTQLKVEDDYITKHKIKIGKGSLIARNTLIRTSDGHCLLEPKTNKPINVPEDVIIGNHCWIMAYCVILKGSVIPDNCAVAAKSLINKSFKEESCLLVGTPAQILKKNIKWDRHGYCFLMNKDKADKNDKTNN